MTAWDLRAVRAVGVVGLGLIGASFAARLRERLPGVRVLGHDPDPVAARRALDGDFVHALRDAPAELVDDVELLVLAMPVGAILRFLDELTRRPPARPLRLLDVGSTKAEIVEAMDRLPDSIRAVGGHPMTGRRTANVDGPDPRLFESTRFVLTPTRRTTGEELVGWRDLVTLLGAEPIELDAARHDRAVARVSHLPRLLPLALLEVVPELDEDARRLLAGGFRAAVRGAADNVPMWTDIVATNRAPIADALDELAGTIEGLARRLRGASAPELEALLEAARDRVARLDESGRS